MPLSGWPQPASNSLSTLDAAPDLQWPPGAGRLSTARRAVKAQELGMIEDLAECQPFRRTQVQHNQIRLLCVHGYLGSSPQQWRFSCWQAERPPGKIRRLSVSIGPLIWRWRITIR